MVGLGFGVGVGASCVPDSGTPLPAAISVTTTDSAGVRITDITGFDPAELPEWTVDSVPALVIGDSPDDPRYQFGAVATATRLASGAVAVVDRSARSIRLFDPSGVYVWTSGRAGEGPGEYGTIFSIDSTEDGRLRVFDTSLSRLTYLDPVDGSVLGTEPHPVQCPPGVGPEPVLPCRTIRLMRDGALVREAGNLYRMAGELGFFRIVIVRQDGYLVVDSLRQPARVEVGTVRWRGTEQSNSSERPFAATDLYGVGMRELAFANSAQFAVRIYGTTGTLERIVRTDLPARPVTPAEVELWVAEHEGHRWLELPAREGAEQVVAALGTEDSVPHISRLEFDRGGWLWVQSYDYQRKGPVTWMVFDEEGAPRGRVEAARPWVGGWPGWIDLLEIGADYILGRDIDEFGVERVAVYGLRRGEGP